MITFPANPNEISVLVNEIEKAGIEFEWRDNVPFSSDDVAAQTIVDNFNAVAFVQAEKILAVKKLAQEKIFSILPDWKQSNYNGRMNELNAIASGNHPIELQRVLTDIEKNEIAVMFAAMQQTIAIRDQSDVHEITINTFSTFSDVFNYDITAGW